MPIHAQRNQQLASLREALNAASQDYLALVKAGKHFSPEFKAAHDVHQRSLAQLKSFLIGAPKVDD